VTLVIPNTLIAVFTYLTYLLSDSHCIYPFYSCWLFVKLFGEVLYSSVVNVFSSSYYRTVCDAVIGAEVEGENSWRERCRLCCRESEAYICRYVSDAENMLLMQRLL